MLFENKIIDCNDDGLEFVENTTFVLSPSESVSGYFHLFNHELEGKCMFKTGIIHIKPKNIINGDLIIPIELLKDHDGVLLREMIYKVTTKICDLIHATAQFGDHVILNTVRYSDLKFEITESTKEKLMKFSDSETIIAQFLWKYNIEQKYKHWGSKVETKTFISLYLFDVIELKEVEDNNNDNQRIIISL